MRLVAVGAHAAAALRAAGADDPPGRAPAAAFGRFEASRPNELWTGDALHGPHIAGRKAYLFAFLDDHSRAVMAARWGYFEDTVRLAAALRPALAARGVPESIYVDNGSAFVDAALKRAAARLGIKITHSAPGRPQGRGKIERFFGVVRQEFLVEIGDGAAVTDLAAAEQAVHRLVRDGLPRPAARETGQPPIERWLPAPRSPPPRRSSCGRRSCGPSSGSSARPPRSSCSAAPTRPTRCWPAAASSCVFDPFDLAIVEVRWNGKPYGLARPQQIRRHTHPKAKPETPAAPPPATGIDYLGIIAAEHEEAARRHRIRYDALAEAAPPSQAEDGQEDGQ